MRTATAARDSDPVATAEKGWRAELALRFGRTGRGTVLLGRRHSGPLTVQKPFYPEGDGVCHVCVIHPPGGIVGGDSLRLEIAAGPRGHGLVTTPGAGKFYRSAGAVARQEVEIRVADGGAVEYLPQETIVYDGAKAEISTRVELVDGASFLGWEIICLGLPASRAPFTRGRLGQRLSIRRNDQPLVTEPACFLGGDPALAGAWGLAGRPVTGTLYCTTAESGLVEMVRAAVAAPAGSLFGVSLLDGVLVCRFLGYDAFVALACFVRAWEVLRPAVLGRAACVPRIWRT